MKYKLFVMLVVLGLLAACAAPEDQNSTVSPVAPEVATAATTETPSVSISVEATEAAPSQVVEKLPTMTVSCSASNTIQFIKDFTAYGSWTFGDEEKWTVSLLTFNKDWENSAVYVVEPGGTVTVTAEEINVFNYTLDGDRENVLCFVSKIGADNSAVKYYVGSQVPEGWSKYE